MLTPEEYKTIIADHAEYVQQLIADGEAPQYAIHWAIQLAGDVIYPHKAWRLTWYARCGDTETYDAAHDLWSEHCQAPSELSLDAMMTDLAYWILYYAVTKALEKRSN